MAAQITRFCSYPRTCSQGYPQKMGIEIFRANSHLGMFFKNFPVQICQGSSSSLFMDEGPVSRQDFGVGCVCCEVLLTDSESE